MAAKHCHDGGTSPAMEKVKKKRTRRNSPCFTCRAYQDECMWQVCIDILQLIDDQRRGGGRGDERTREKEAERINRIEVDLAPMAGMAASTRSSAGTRLIRDS